MEGSGVGPVNMKVDPHLRLALLVLGLVPAWALHAGESVKLAGTGAKAPSVISVGIPELKLPSNVQLPDAVKGLAADFRTRTQNYVDRQRELWKKADGASKSERDQLKEKLKANRAEFLQQTRLLRAELKDRIKELQKTLINSRPMDDGVGERGGRGRRGN